jgi:hypothetical protein
MHPADEGIGEEADPEDQYRQRHHHGQFAMIQISELR